MNVAAVMPRDYSLIGRDTKRAEELGLASAEWYKAPIARKRLKELMQRDDEAAIRDTIIWFAAFLVTGGLAVAFWPGWWSLPFFLAYGVLYGSSTDSRWHECGHGTAFKTRWMNDVIYQIACFMIMREPTVWRWSHARHHTDTIIVGRDPEIAVMRPAVILKVVLGFGAHHVWRLAACDDRIDAACGARRGCARSTAQFAHRLYEPGLALSVLEHELPYRASHVPDGPLPCAAEAA